MQPAYVLPEIRGRKLQGIAEVPAEEGLLGADQVATEFIFTARGIVLRAAVASAGTTEPASTGVTECDRVSGAIQVPSNVATEGIKTTHELTAREVVTAGCAVCNATIARARAPTGKAMLHTCRT